MRIDDARIADIRHVVANMRASDAREFMALSHAPDHARLVDEVCDRFALLEGVIVARDGPVPAAIGALVETRPNVITLAFLATDRFRLIALPLTRFLAQRLLPAVRAAGAHRIECLSIEGHQTAHRWVETLGLTREATLRGFGRAGETFIQFSWVADHVRKAGAGK